MYGADLNSSGRLQLSQVGAVATTGSGYCAAFGIGTGGALFVAKDGPNLRDRDRSDKCRRRAVQAHRIAKVTSPGPEQPIFALQ
jgi:hypothetical protein